ncbi:site-specific integrase [Lactococcus lactis]|uniref:site-specific integrase n=1 Tax=Lactococcus lactis TaxID=1358 RepID=UPI00223C04F1|nr:site-specific integrase [Lactococcus lactis]MCT1179900.1 site-specific integrase [Lactococcus lactis]
MARYIKRGKVWQYEISYKDTDGKYKKLRKSGFPKKADAISEAGEIEANLAKGFYTVSQDILLTDHFKQWIEIFKKGKVSDGTYRKYLYTLSVLKKHFSTATIKTMNRVKYQEMLNEFAEGHSDSSVKQINVHVRASLENLLDDFIIKNDFTKGAISKGGKGTKSAELKYLDFQDFTKLIAFAKEKINPIYSSSFMIYIAAMTGMRFSELLGLTWDNVDFEKGQIYVKRTWDIYKNNFAPTKNDQSVRFLAVDGSTLQVMTSYKEQQEKLLKRLEIEPEHPFVFYNIKNGLITNNSLNKQLRNMCKKLGFEKTITCHGLRHTHASTMLYKGINILYVSKRLGHSSLNVTMSVYSHILKELEEKDNENIKKIFSEINDE